MKLKEELPRPEIKNAKVLDDTREIEKFQNETLRPIIKMRHTLLIEVFKNELKNSKKSFSNLTQENKIQLLNNLFIKDNVLRNKLIGITIGHFTILEYVVYSKNIVATNKRIISIVKERILSSMNEIN